MKKFNWLPVIVIMAVVISSCGTTAQVQKDNTVDFTKIRTYAWAEASTKDTSDRTPKNNELIDLKIRESIDANLFNKGWILNKTNPDVLIAYDVDVERENRNLRTPVYSEPMYRYMFSPYSRRWITLYYPSELMGYHHSTETVQQHTLTVTLVDAKTDKTIWQGWTTMDSHSRRMTDREINTNVRAIIKKLER